jgi:hypothetical protein
VCLLFPDQIPELLSLLSRLQAMLRLPHLLYQGDLTQPRLGIDLVSLLVNF